MWPSELIVSDAIGRVIEFWGFKRNMGRVWAVLYLSDQPVSAKDIGERLHISTGAVSMTVTELMRWGVIRKIWVQGERRDYFAAEGNLWKMVSRVIRERELVEVNEVIGSLESALTVLDERVRQGNAAEKRRAQVQRDRITKLLELAKLGKSLVEALISTARVDAGPLVRFLLGQKA
jgi:HTH-type transcriptional regulator, glycine betaine synthesis regulator